MPIRSNCRSSNRLSNSGIGVRNHVGTACRPANLVECLLNLEFEFIQATQNLSMSVFQPAEEFFGSSPFFRQADTRWRENVLAQFDFNLTWNRVSIDYQRL